MSKIYVFQIWKYEIIKIIELHKLNKYMQAFFNQKANYVFEKNAFVLWSIYCKLYAYIKRKDK